MNEWWLMMLKKHGERLFFMVLAFLGAGLCFVLSKWAITVPDGPLAPLAGAGVTVIIGLVMLCYNKARGSDAVKDEEPK